MNGPNSLVNYRGVVFQLHPMEMNRSLLGNHLFATYILENQKRGSHTITRENVVREWAMNYWQFSLYTAIQIARIVGIYFTICNQNVSQKWRVI